MNDDLFYNCLDRLGQCMDVPYNITAWILDKLWMAFSYLLDRCRA